MMSMSMGSMGSMSGMSGMGNMSMGTDIPGFFYLLKMYWAVVGGAIGADTVANLLYHVLAYQR